jgi:hypothetical protein
LLLSIAMLSLSASRTVTAESVVAAMLAGALAGGLVRSALNRVRAARLR